MARWCLFTLRSWILSLEGALAAALRLFLPYFLSAPQCVPPYSSRGRAPTVWTKIIVRGLHSPVSVMPSRERLTTCRKVHWGLLLRFKLLLISPKFSDQKKRNFTWSISHIDVQYTFSFICPLFETTSSAVISDEVGHLCLRARFCEKFKAMLVPEAPRLWELCCVFYHKAWLDLLKHHEGDWPGISESIHKYIRVGNIWSICHHLLYCWM